LNNTHQTINRQIFEQLNDAEYLPLNIGDDLTLWEYCKKFEHVINGENHTPVLLLDQFEELFTLYQNQPEVQQDFIGQLADVINGTPPAHLRDAVKPQWSESELKRYFAPPKVHIVISLRSDYLYLLDRLSERIPAILSCRYELQALEELNARQAITQPAGLGSGSAPLTDTFASPPFLYSPEALDDIVDSLTVASEHKAFMALGATQKEAEAFQLQLLCRYIEKKIIDGKHPAGYEVTPDFYGGKEGVLAILSEFYAEVLAQFDAERKPGVRRLVEEKLLSNDRRILQEREFLKQECGVTDADLALLTRERLLKEEPRGGSFYYEISHDTLVTPIAKAKAIRRREEAAIIQEQEQRAAELRAKEAEEQARIETTRREEAERLQKTAERGQKRARFFSFIAVGIAVLALVALAFAIQQQRLATAKQLEVEENKRKTEIEKQKTQEAERKAAEQEEAERVWKEVNDRIVRAGKLPQKYAKEAANLLNEAKIILDQYPNNSILQSRRKEANL